MPGAKYHTIYEDLKKKIETHEYEFQTLLPSEAQLTVQYGCSRNTVRRAIKELADQGYVQSVHGKGVQIIFQRPDQAEFLLSGIESLKEAVARNKRDYVTKVICFAELTVDERMEKRTSFPVGTEVYYVQRVRYIDGEALIIDHNYFRRDIVRGLTRDIAEKSVYEYMEGTLGENIVTTKRKLTVERNTELDATYLKLRDYNCMAVVSSHTFNGEGVMFEYTQSRHRPDRFVFYDQAQRVK